MLLMLALRFSKLNVHSLLMLMTTTAVCGFNGRKSDTELERKSS